MDNGESSSNNPIRVGVGNISDGDIDIEVIDRVAPTDGQDVLIGVDNHSVCGNNNIKVHDMDLRGCGNARVGAGNYAHGSNNIFVGRLDPTDGSSCNSDDPSIPPIPPIRPSGFGGRSLNPLPSMRYDHHTRSLHGAHRGPLRSVESEDISGSSLPRRGRRSTTARFAIGTMSNGRQLPDTARMNRSKTMDRGPIPPLPPNPPNPPFSA